MYEVILWFAVAYILLMCTSLIMVTTTRPVFISIFQTEHISAVKFELFDTEYEKNNELSCDTKISKSLQKIEKIGLELL